MPGPIRLAAALAAAILLATPALAQKPTPAPLAPAQMLPETPALPLAEEVVGYALANQPTADEYRADLTFSYTTSREAVTITRFAEGLWRIRFNGTAPFAGSGQGAVGYLAVSAYNSNATCLSDFVGGTAEEPLTAFVRCYDPATGAQVDTQYSVAAMRRADGGSPTMAYAANGTPGASSTVDSGYDYHPAGTPIPITREGTGRYTVRFSGLTLTGGGHVQVNAANLTGADLPEVSCISGGWFGTGTEGEIDVRVGCFDGSGAFVDARFFVLFLSSDTDSRGGLGYAWADDAAAASYTPNSSWSHNSAGGGVTATRSGVGEYELTFAGLGSSQQGANVQVTSYVDAYHCTVRGWSAIAPDVLVRVQCFDAAGAPADSRYQALVTWPDRPASASGPPNDGFANAAGFDGSVSTTVTGTNVDATLEAGEIPASCQPSSDASVWYFFVAPADGTVTLDFDASTYDTVVSMYVDTFPDFPGAGAEVACNDDTTDLQSRLSDVPVTAGTFYAVRVAGFRTSGGVVREGDISFDYTFSPPTSAEGAPGAELALGVAPNPTAGPTRVQAELGAAGAATVTVHDALGREVARLHDGPAARALSLEWDAAGLPAGVYVVRLAAGAGVQTRRVTVVR